MCIYCITLNVRLVQTGNYSEKKVELCACLAIGCCYCCNYRGPLSIMSHSQSQCEDIVAHKHSRDFRMWYTCVQPDSCLEPQSCSWVVLINACICQEHSLQSTDGPSCNISYLHPVSAHTCFRKTSAALTFCHSHLSFPFKQ